MNLFYKINFYFAISLTLLFIFIVYFKILKMSILTVCKLNKRILGWN
ncbi:hypothetical protein E27107_320048 [Elizabethkingia anophelis]|nr:hypothetical protein E27107_320048 [Elizabethkingia anophelis]